MQLCKNKIVDNTWDSVRRVEFHLIYKNERHVVTATYHLKRKLLELRCKKKKEFVRGKKLTQAGVFPLKMQDDEHQWKLELNYDAENSSFKLAIDGKDFLLLPF